MYRYCNICQVVIISILFIYIEISIPQVIGTIPVQLYTLSIELKFRKQIQLAQLRHNSKSHLQQTIWGSVVMGIQNTWLKCRLGRSG